MQRGGPRDMGDRDAGGVTLTFVAPVPLGVREPLFT
jgi:hypothetical protein